MSDYNDRYVKALGLAAEGRRMTLISWDALPNAILGMYVCIFGTIISILVVSVQWHEGNHIASFVLSAIGFSGVVWGYVKLINPWSSALDRLRKNTEALEEFNAKSWPNDPQ